MTGPGAAFLVGAPRSGTKLLRDTLARHPDVATLPLSLDRLWRRGTDDLDHDAFPVSRLDPSTRERIREDFADRFGNGSVLLEKNTRHSLRMEYVNAVFPDARYLHLVRDPRDAVPSIRARWRQPLDISYLLRNPWWFWSHGDLLRPGLRNVVRLLGRKLTGRDRIAAWGPRLQDLDELLDRRTLFEVCCLQWKRCVEGVLAFEADHAQRVHRLSYENLVRSPKRELGQVLDHLDLAEAEEVQRHAQRYYTTGSVGARRRELTPEESTVLREELDELMDRLGYTDPVGEHSGA